MHFLGSKYHTHVFTAGALPQTLLGEVTVPPYCLAGWVGGKGGMEGEGEGEGRERGKGRR